MRSVAARVRSRSIFRGCLEGTYEQSSIRIIARRSRTVDPQLYRHDDGQTGQTSVPAFTARDTTSTAASA